MGFFLSDSEVSRCLKLVCLHFGVFNQKKSRVLACSQVTYMTTGPTNWRIDFGGCSINATCCCVCNDSANLHLGNNTPKLIKLFILNGCEHGLSIIIVDSIGPGLLKWGNDISRRRNTSWLFTKVYGVSSWVQPKNPIKNQPENDTSSSNAYH